MKSSLVLAFLLSTTVQAFAPHNMANHKMKSAIHASYVPEGLTEGQYKQIKEQEKRKNVGKNLGALGPRGFKSRSMQAWQEAYEKGLATHEIAPFGYREALKAGKLKKEDVPYMVRGGSWDNSDVKGAKNKRQWLKTDRVYAKGGYKKQQSASLLGSGPGFDWTGKRPRDENMKNNVVPGFS
mmetsp:Transcript_32920/g.49702  ORF Transcript_32920/g.49702 Transcript_32920/m.49702 type:complete len:182 (+) Transcript_32920:246-791(+)|eukprot:CAMPEP_0178921906 /NCGR_PEP_ID=MMETSP0786-20121207/15831_1 /TAXON_ID=186022 /ORGANISM="Thalassionema frauenfeldii, Strain CCMP 1798" /LENGTH=181 /DNA_ID=CAMNT_0020596157 /DNA_START=214 /DNA_END=759 /DNA_ORIENTATION=-